MLYLRCCCVIFLRCMRGGVVVWEVGEGRGMMMSKSCGFVSAYHFFISLIKYWVNYFAFYGWTLIYFCHTASCLIDVAGRGLEIHRRLILKVFILVLNLDQSLDTGLDLDASISMFRTSSCPCLTVQNSSTFLFVWSFFLCACDFIVSCFAFFIIGVWLYTLKIILTFPLWNTYLASQRSKTHNSKTVLASLLAAV